jgi:hypothetical protein
MPKVTFYYTPTQQTTPVLLSLALAVRTAVAQIMSTPEHPLPIAAVDWLPLEVPEGAVMAAHSFEIETIGFPDRKAKVGDGKELKAAFYEIADLHKLIKVQEWTQPLIWIKYVDPDGPHV